MNAPLPKVLIVESAPALQDSYAQKYNLGAVSSLLHAYSVEEAQTLFSQHADVAIIAVSARVGSAEVNTAPLVEQFRQSGFKGPIVAVSPLRKHRDLLKAVGANFQAENKSLSDMVRYLLDEMANRPARTLRRMFVQKMRLMKARWMRGEG